MTGNQTLLRNGTQCSAEKEIIAACLYVLVGTVGIVVNVLHMIGVGMNKKLRSPFYYYLSNMCVVDTLVSFCLGPYSGLTLAFNATSKLRNSLVSRISGMLLDVSYYQSGWYLILVALTRLFIFALPQRAEFSRSVKLGSSCFLWFCYLALTCSYVIGQQPVYYLDRDFLTWTYNDSTANGVAMLIYNMVHNTATSAILWSINAATLYAVRKSRNQIISFNPADRVNNRKLEIKLLVQCLLTSTFYSAGLLTVMIAMCIAPHSCEWYMGFHLLWMCNHIVNSAVCLCFNKQVRRSLFNFGRSFSTVAA